MKKVAITVLGVLALAASANAQGTWYTDKALWESLTTVSNTANYNALGDGFMPGPVIENGVTATASGGFYIDSRYPALSSNSSSIVPLGFTFSGNAFGGMFGMTDSSFNWITDGMNFSVDGSVTNVYSITSPSITNTYAFLGYISDSSSPISVKFSGDSTPQLASVDSFSFGNGTNPSAPGGAVPEPGTVVSMGLLGAGVLGLVIRSRRRMSN
jgi:hypothetical protein